MKTDKYKGNSRTTSDGSLSRRHFLRLSGLGIVAVEGTNVLGMPALAQADRTVPALPGTGSLTVNLPYKEYQFEITKKEVNPDGTPVTALTINGQIPGPQILVAEGGFIALYRKEWAYRPAGYDT